MATTSTTLINQVANWLMSQALRDTDLETVVMGCCERLHAAGIPIYRGYFGFTVLHPLYRAMGFTWTRGKGVSVAGYPHVPGGASDKFKDSPHRYMMERNLDYLRVRLEDARGLQFPIFDDLRTEGGTDYLAFLASFTPGVNDGMLGSWSCDRAGGFLDEEIDALLRIQDRLAVACKMAVRAVLTRNVVHTYLGANAGNRVLSGQIHRGDGESIEAAIWYSDLRGSTKMADGLPRQEYIDALNAYFDAAGGAVVDSGGEILSFIGDAMLAIFPSSPSPKAAAKSSRRAVDATADALDRLRGINKGRAEPLNFGVALHRGEVMFGNVGVPERLTFSVFGSAVNEVVRIEKLTSQLTEPVLVSDDFADTLELPWRSLGQHALSGVERNVSIYAPPDGELSRPRAKILAG